MVESGSEEPTAAGDPCARYIQSTPSDPPKSSVDSYPSRSSITCTSCLHLSETSPPTLYISIHILTLSRQTPHCPVGFQRAGAESVRVIINLSHYILIDGDVKEEQVERSMGNHMCCAQASKTMAAAKVIRWDDGDVEEFREAIKVGELMMDNPQQFICNFSDLRAGVRISALPAEEELLLGGVYVLLPMKKYLRGVLLPSDMTSLNLLAFNCNSGHRKLSCDSRIFPALGTGNSYEIRSKQCSTGRSDLKEKVAEMRVDEDEDHSLVLGLHEHRIGGFRYWQPALETIKESTLVCKP